MKGHGRHTPTVGTAGRRRYEVCTQCGKLRELRLSRYGRPLVWRDAWGEDEKRMVAEVRANAVTENTTAARIAARACIPRTTSSATSASVKADGGAV